jgi:hypothetical protein
VIHVIDKFLANPDYNGQAAASAWVHVELSSHRHVELTDPIRAVFRMAGYVISYSSAVQSASAAAATVTVPAEATATARQRNKASSSRSHLDLIFLITTGLITLAGVFIILLWR